MTQQYRLTVEEICSKLRPVFGRKMDEIYLRYAMADTREEKEEITQILYALYNKNLDKLLGNQILLEPPLKESVEGEYKLAEVSYANKSLYNFNLREHDWPRHVCISGMSGSGKTTLGFHIIEKFIENKKPFVIFDWKKSFRPLTLKDSELMVYTIGNDNISNNFKFNINSPPENVSPKEWINVLCDLITESFMTSFGVHKVLLETLDEAFKEYGVYNGGENYPTWNYIKWKLEAKFEKAKGRNSTWLESALRVVNVLTFGDFGKVCNYKGKESLKIEDLLNKKILFELNSLGNIEKKFFCEFILTYIYKLKKTNQNEIKDRFESAILVDEAHNIFLKDKTHFVKESVTDMIYREMREYGISLICLDQHISKISDTVKGNSACHIAFQQQLPADIYDISELMQLRERKQYFSNLAVGSAIVKLSERHTRPFLIQVENSELRKSVVSDGDIKQRMEFIKTGETLKTQDKEFYDDLVKEDLSNIQDRTSKVNEIEKQEPQSMILGDNIKIKNNKISTPNLSDKLSDMKIEPIKDNEIKELTKVQEALYNIVKQGIDNKMSLAEIERVLEANKSETGYSLEDVSKAINYFLKQRFEDISFVTNREQNLYKCQDTQIIPSIHKEKTEQERFIAFLQENPDHSLSTVDVYKKIGLSARKGNKIKNELIEKGLIIIEEQKYNKGWKKLIRLSNQLVKN